MALLLDTHVWIWSQAAPENLGIEAETLLAAPEESLFLSPVSTLEIARLISGGRLVLKENLDDWISTSVEFLNCATADFSHQVAMAAYALPGRFHRDPADRMLVATARVHELTLLTADQRILDYAHVDSRDARA